MKKEDIEKAAVNYDSRAVAYRAFKAGARWRINSIWHKTNEIPNLNTLILVEREDGVVSLYKLFSKPIVLNWKRWAYVKDLLPNMEE